MKISDNKLALASYANAKVLYCKLFRKNKSFVFREKRLDYFFHPYNNTTNNERTIEIPIIMEMIRGHSEDGILEVGNVLKHYFPAMKHDVLDKYEKADGVMNEDIADFKPRKKYRLIVSISTLEHVGWDETPRETEKFGRSMNNMEGMLEEGGRIIFTVPIGYNPAVKQFVEKGGIHQLDFMRRLNAKNEWEECPWEQIKEMKYNEPFHAANGVIVGVVLK